MIWVWVAWIAFAVIIVLAVGFTLYAYWFGDTD